MKNIALFGGAYNPCHLGHIEISQFILDTRKEFDEVWLMPTYHHMYNKNTESGHHRLNICSIACEMDDRIKVFDYEIKNKLYGETYYTIEKLLSDSDYNTKYTFSFIIGIDNANTFDKWFKYQELQSMIRFVILPRNNYTVDENAWYMKKPHTFLDGYKDTFDVSSTKIRDLFKKHYACSPIDVEDEAFRCCSELEISTIQNNILKYLDMDACRYIIKHNLYQ